METGFKKKLPGFMMVLISAILITSAAYAAGGEDMEALTAKASDVYQLDTVVITATRTEKNLLEVPANVVVITSADIRDKKMITITDALAGVSGITIDRPKGIADSTGGITMRGFDENDILVLYNGMPMNSAYSGGVDWSAIPVDNIERIEVAKGAGSSLYGGRAVAGVVNIITSDPDNSKISARITEYYGTNNTWRHGFSVSQKLNDRFSYYLSYENKSTDGFHNKWASYTGAGAAKPKGTVATGLVVSRKVDGKPRYIIGIPGNGAGRNETFNLKLKYDFDKDKNISYSYSHNKLRHWSEDPITYMRDAAGNPLYKGSVKLPNGKWFNFSESDFTDYYSRRTTDVHSVRYADDKNSFYINLGMTDIKDSGYSTGDFFDGSKPGKDTSYPSRSIKADILKTWEIGDKNTLTAGMDWQNHSMTRTIAELNHWHDKNSISKIVSVDGGKNEVFAIFVQNEYAFSDRWKLYAGLRYDHYKKYGGYHDEPGKYVAFEDSVYNEISPKIALEYQPDESTSYYLSYGHSFNPPSIFKLYRWDKTYIGNPNLKPEKSNTLEFGVKKKFGDRTMVNLSLYQSRTDDMIVAEKAPEPYTDKKWYNNINKAERIGLDFDLTHKFSDRWSGYLNYSWVRVTDSDGNRIYSFPRDVFHAGLSYRYDKWTAALDMEYTGSRNAPGEVSGVYLAYDEFFVANIGVSYQASKNCKVTFNVDNIFDRNYYQMYPAPGRTFTLGLQLEM